MFKFSTEGIATTTKHSPRHEHGKLKVQKTCDLVIFLKSFLSSQNVANVYLFENTSGIVSDINSVAKSFLMD